MGELYVRWCASSLRCVEKTHNVMNEPMKNPVMKHEAVRARTSLNTDRSLDSFTIGTSSRSGGVGAARATGGVISGFTSVGVGRLGSAAGVDCVGTVAIGLVGSEDGGVGRSV